MSIATTVRTAGPFAGTGSLVALPFAFKVFAASDLVVQRTNAAGDVATLTLTTHYSVSLNADQDTSPGGTVTLVTALAVGETAALTSSVSATQPLQLASGGPFLPGQIEDALDRAMIVVQQQGVLGEQTLRVPLGETALILPSADQRANKALLFDADGDPYLAAPASGSAADVMLQYASTASGKGAALVGADAAVDYPDDTIGFLVVKNTSNGYNALRGFSKVEQALIQAGTSVSNHATTLDSMLSTEKHLYLPRGTWRRSTKWSLGSGLRLEGAGQGLAQILLTADVVGLEMSGEFVRVEGIGIAKTGAHTSNGINIGTTGGSRADRSFVRDVVVTGMGGHGIAVLAGNLGTLAGIRVRSNTGDGLNFNRAVSVDNHAWKIDGFIDASLNSGHGVRFEDGTSLGDANASKCHHGGLIVAQSNTLYGVYVGTSRNRLTVYAESNTAGQVYIGQFAGGNEILIQEGAVTGNVGGVAGNLDGNHIILLNHNADTRAGFKSKANFSGGSGNGVRISGDDGTAGFFDLEKTAARQIDFLGSGSSGGWLTRFKNTVAGFFNTLQADGGFFSATSTVSIPTATATTVASFGVLSTDAFCGVIHVRDQGGTLTGSSAIVTNFTSGGSQVLQLAALNNSSASGSALTVSGGNIQFAHTFGSTRTFAVTLHQVGIGKTY